MDIDRHVHAIQADLAAAAALGDEATAAAGERLAAAVSASLQLRVLDVLTDATLALNAQLSSGHVEVRLAGREPRPRRRRRRHRRGRDRADAGRRPQRAHHPPAPGGAQGADRGRREQRGRLDQCVDRSRAIPCPRAAARQVRAAASDFKATPRARGPSASERITMSIHHSFFGSVDLPDVDELPPAPSSPRRRPRRPPATARAAGGIGMTVFETTGQVALRVSLERRRGQHRDQSTRRGSRSSSWRCATTTSRGRRSRRPGSR